MHGYIFLAIFSQEIILKMVFAFTFCCSGQSLSWLGVGAKVSLGLILFVTCPGVTVFRPDHISQLQWTSGLGRLHGPEMVTLLASHGLRCLHSLSAASSPGCWSPIEVAWLEAGARPRSADLPACSFLTRLSCRLGQSWGGAESSPAVPASHWSAGPVT